MNHFLEIVKSGNKNNHVAHHQDCQKPILKSIIIIFDVKKANATLRAGV